MAEEDLIVTRSEEEPSENAPLSEREAVVVYCEETEKALSDFADGLTSTREETACARRLRDELSPLARTRMEAFRTPPYAGRNCCALRGVSYFFAALFYFVSFGGNRADGVALIIVALAVFVAGGAAAGAAFLGAKGAVRWLYPKKVSYNVFSENMPLKRQDGDRIVIVASSHDASPGSYFTDFDRVRKTVFVVVPVSAALFVLFCLVKMFVGSDTVPKITALTVLPFINSVAGIAALLLHFSPFQRHARENNGVATSVALSVYKRLLSEPSLLPEGTRVCFVSFGGEHSAHAGSRAFAAAHPEIKGGKAIVFGDVMSGDFSLIRGDALRKKIFSEDSASALFGAVEATGVPCLLPPTDGIGTKLNALHGYDATALAEAGCDCAMFVAKDYGGKGKPLMREDAGRLYDLALHTLTGMIGEDAAKGEEDNG